MLDNLLAIIAPHHCCACDKAGTVFCDNCKYNITSEKKMVCIVCGRPTSQIWLCGDCDMPYERAWAVAERAGALQRLINLYKFERTREAYRPLGDLLLSALPDLPPNTIIVPLPTVASHIRQRGYDHMKLIGKYVAKKLHLQYRPILVRKTTTFQRQATARQRELQAQKAFAVSGNIDNNAPYLLIDDIMTTGASIKYAAKALKDAGAKSVWVAIIARQQLK